MDRRDFLLMIGAAVVAPPRLAPPAPAARLPLATVLYDDRAVTLTTARSEPQVKDALWVRKTDLPRINDFELKPQGACRADLCIPISRAMVRGEYFNLTAFARTIGESCVADATARVWSFSEIPVLRGAFLSSRMAPDFSLADRKGRLVRLSGFRGKKVLVLTWASW
jgi:hypothetical protein